MGRGRRRFPGVRRNGVSDSWRPPGCNLQQGQRRADNPPSIEHLNLCRQNALEYQKTVITGEELRGCAAEPESNGPLEMLLSLTPRTGVFWTGGDWGYTNDPTEIVVFEEVELPACRIIKLLLWVRMEHVAYPQITETIALLDRYHTAAGIGADDSGNRPAVAQELPTMDKYKELVL